MSQDVSKSFERYFGDLKDPRIDGKTLCNRVDEASGTKAIHMVSAFATGARLVLAQQKVDEKSNEITAIPKVLDMLALKEPHCDP